MRTERRLGGKEGSPRALRVAMVGTRGVPAHYGGFETAVEEIGRRLVDRGHEVTVYCRGADKSLKTYLGMRLVHLPAPSSKQLETLVHSALSTAHLVGSRRHDAAIMFNAANAPFVPLLRARGIPTAIHVDGLEWQRAKWAGAGRRYYRAVESLSVRWADALIADAPGIADYYTREFGVETELLAYGAPIQVDVKSDRLEELRLVPSGYHVVVARFEPENHVLEIVQGYRASQAELPLVVVGSAPYADSYTREIRAAAGNDPRIRLLGGIWDQAQLDQLYGNALTYLHGHSVGGTNPSLLRAMGAGTAVLAWDVVFNRTVLGDTDATYFSTAAQVTQAIEEAELEPAAMTAAGAHSRMRAAQNFRWDDVASGYEQLLVNLADRVPMRSPANGRRLVAARGRAEETPIARQAGAGGSRTAAAQIPKPVSESPQRLIHVGTDDEAFLKPLADQPFSQLLPTDVPDPATIETRANA